MDTHEYQAKALLAEFGMLFKLLASISLFGFEDNDWLSRLIIINQRPGPENFKS